MCWCFFMACVKVRGEQTCRGGRKNPINSTLIRHNHGCRPRRTCRTTLRVKNTTLRMIYLWTRVLLYDAPRFVSDAFHGIFFVFCFLFFRLIFICTNYNPQQYVAFWTSGGHQRFIPGHTCMSLGFYRALGSGLLPHFVDFYRIFRFFLLALLRSP